MGIRPRHQPRAEEHRSPGAQEPLGRRRGHGLRPSEQLRCRVRELLIRDVQGPQLKHLAALVGHADGRRVEVEELDHAARDGVEGRLEREALREGVGDLVEAAELSRGAALGFERALQPLAELLGPLVQARVLNGDGELAREREQETLLPLPVGTRAAS